MRFSERLQALAHCHDLLVKDSWHGASFHDLVTAQMRPFGENDAGRIDAGGPPVILKPDAVQDFGLSFARTRDQCFKAWSVVRTARRGADPMAGQRHR